MVCCVASLKSYNFTKDRWAILKFFCRFIVHSKAMDNSGYAMVVKLCMFYLCKCFGHF